MSTEPFSYIELKVFPSRMEAEMAQEILTRARIPSLIQSDDIGVFGPGHFAAPMGAKLMVRGEDLSRAKALLTGII